MSGPESFSLMCLSWISLNPVQELMLSRLTKQNVVAQLIIPPTRSDQQNPRGQGWFFKRCASSASQQGGRTANEMYQSRRLRCVCGQRPSSTVSGERLEWEGRMWRTRTRSTAWVNIWAAISKMFLPVFVSFKKFHGAMPGQQFNSTCSFSDVQPEFSDDRRYIASTPGPAWRIRETRGNKPRT